MRRRKTAAQPYRAILDAAAAEIISVDGAGTITYLNQSARRLFRCNREQMVGQNIAALVTGDVMNRNAIACDWIADHGAITWHGETLGKRTDGSLVPLTFDAAEWSMRGDRSITFTVREHTDAEAIEEHYIQAQRMYELGRLAGNVAHDFNNLIMIIRASAELARMPGGEPDSVERHLDDVQRAADHASALVGQLLTYVRQESIEPQSVELNTLISDSARLLRSLLGPNIELVTRLDEKLWQVRADPTQLVQVLVNLAVNARDAMPGGGMLFLETTNTPTTGRCVKPFAAAFGGYAMLSVRDTGIGMTSDIRASLFEPFFTTKAPGKGSGIGLAYCRHILHAWGGFIDAESEPGQGTTIRVYLPRLAEPEPNGG